VLLKLVVIAIVTVTVSTSILVTFRATVMHVLLVEVTVTGNDISVNFS